MNNRKIEKKSLIHKFWHYQNTIQKQVGLSQNDIFLYDIDFEHSMEALDHVYITYE